MAKLQLEDYKGARKAADAAVACDPEDEWGHRLRAEALIELMRADEAYAAALEATRLAPDYPPAYSMLARAAQAHGKRQEAERAARHAVELDPEDPGAHHALGEVLFDQHRYGLSADAFADALRLDPEDARTLNNFALARLQGKDAEGTAEQFESAARLDPRLDYVRWNILHTGTAGRLYVLRRATIALLLVAVLVRGTPLPAGLCVVLAGALELERWLLEARLSAPTRRLYADDRRARRFKPHRWDWFWWLRWRIRWWLF
jgi:tetratricopeptide (TPR) repeat protein